jgi:hypothetical protein
MQREHGDILDVGCSIDRVRNAPETVRTQITGDHKSQITLCVVFFKILAHHVPVDHAHERLDIFCAAILVF